MTTRRYVQYRIAAAYAALAIALLFGCTDNSTANSHHRFYISPIVGFGSTDWSLLIASCKGKPTDATNPDPDGIYNCDLGTLQMAAPIAASDSGITLGAVLGYHISPIFAAELRVLRFPKTSVLFDPSFNYYHEKYGINALESNTTTVSALGKFITPIGHSSYFAYANAGVNCTHRYDLLANTYHITPTFGLGLGRRLNDSTDLSLEFTYIAGIGRATNMPAEDYIPFLYSIHARLDIDIPTA